MFSVLKFIQIEVEINANLLTWMSVPVKRNFHIYVYE